MASPVLLYMLDVPSVVTTGARYHQARCRTPDVDDVNPVTLWRGRCPSLIGKGVRQARSSEDKDILAICSHGQSDLHDMSMGI